MALTGPTLAPLVYADYLSAIPTATAANRSNTTTGVLPHNVPLELVTAISGGFADALVAIPILDNYVGSAGTTATPTLTPPIFNPGLISSALATFLSSMAWAGPSGALIANILITSFFARVTSITQIQMNPIPGGATGAGAVTPASNPSLGAGFTSACSAAIMAKISASGYFNVGDVPGGSPTPQIALLVANLSTAYGTVVGGVTATIPYVGVPTTPTAPLTVVNTGKFL